MTTFGWRSFCVFLWVLILAVFLFWLAPHVRAQTPTVLPGGCGTITMAGNGKLTVTGNGRLCTDATVTASVSGFTPSVSGARGTPLTVTTSDSSGTLPTGAVVVVSNVGTTNPMYCNVNAVAATASDQLITANGGWFAFTIPASVTTLRCIATGGSTTANMVGGSGLATGTGGGSGGGGGGAVTNAGTFAVQLTGATNNINNITGTTSLPTLAATSTKQSDGSQKTQIVDGSGNVIAATSNALNVSVTNTNANGQATMANSSPVVIASNQTSFPVAATLGAETTKNIGTTSQLPYPSGATPITASATGTSGATTATLAGTSGKTTYICWYSIRANATAATTVTNTITGVISGTLSSIMWVAPAASGIGLDEMIFNPCVPASATNTGIAVVSGAPGSNGLVSSKAGGYQL